MLCMFAIGLSPAWFGAACNVRSGPVTVLLLLMLCFSFPLGMALWNYLEKRFSLKLFD